MCQSQTFLGYMCHVLPYWFQRDVKHYMSEFIYNMSKAKHKANIALLMCQLEAKEINQKPVWPLNIIPKPEK